MSLKNFENIEEHENLSYGDTIKLLKKLLEHGKVEGIVRRMKHLHASIIRHTAFVDDLENIKISTRIKILLNGLVEFPKCKECGDDVQKVNKKENWFSDYCTRNCSKLAAGRKAAETSRKNNNGVHHNATPEMQERVRLRNIELYGEENWMRTPEGRLQARKNLHTEDARNKAEESMMMNYGVRNIGEAYHIFDNKRQKTNNTRYEGGHPSRDPRVKILKSETFMKNYGSSQFLGSELGEKLKIEGMVREYGVDNYFKTEKFQEDLRERNMRELGVYHHLQSEESVDTIMETEWCKEFIESNGYDFEKMCKESNTSLTTVLRYLEEHGLYQSKTRSSILEEMLSDFLTSENIHHERNIRISGKEADIFIPSEKLAIECNGNYFHSEVFKNSRYHIDKTLLFEKNGVMLLHFFEDEILYNFDIVKRMILSKTNNGINGKIFARKTKIRNIESKTANEFYENTHIQGKVKAKTHYGLYHNNKLVACMSFRAGSRNLEDGEYELVRFSSSTTVVGGFSKLLKNFINHTTDVDKIISYADRRISNGNVYDVNGFELTKKVSPSYYYLDVKNYLKRYRKERFKKSELAKKYADMYDENLTEAENAENVGFVRIYDCGLLKFEWTRD